MKTVASKKSIFKIGEEVLISPEVTHKTDWIKGKVFKIENNPYVGFVINVATDDDNVYFEKEYLFKHFKDEKICTQ